MEKELIVIKQKKENGLNKWINK